MKVFIGPYPNGDFNRKIEITIDGYDTWSLDHTLSLVITAALKEFLEHPHGAPMISNDDVPPELHRPADAEDWKTDENTFKRWDWVIGEMLFAFEQGTKDDDYTIPEEVRKATEARAYNGRMLFAKYFHALWN